MISIRRNTFETNSSSTHCLAIVNSKIITENDEQFLQSCNYVIEPLDESYYSSYSIDEDDIKEKLRYLWTLYLQAGNDGTDKAFQVLQSIVPNVIFRFIPRNTVYIFEDGDYLFNNYTKAEISPWINEPQTLKMFILYGKVEVWNRDDEALSDLAESKVYPAAASISWTG